MCNSIKYRCVEIGTGSGYIICSVAMMLKQKDVSCHCIGVDINPDATLCTQQTLHNHEASCSQAV